MLFFKAYFLRLAVGAFCTLFFDYVIDGFGLSRRLLFRLFFGRVGFALYALKSYKCKFEDMHYCKTYDEDDDEIYKS